MIEDNMKITYRVLISISASVGFAFFLISALAMVKAMRVHLASQPAESFWETYMHSSNGYDAYAFYFIGAAFVFFLLFYILEVQKKLRF